MLAQAPSSHRWPLRVYYEDTDAAGVVYYANYLKFCERARTEYLRSMGFEQGALARERGLLFVVSRVEADYLRSAELDDGLEVQSTLAELGGARLVFAQHIVRGAQRMFSARVTIACVDAHSRRPTAIPDALRKQFAAPQPHA